MIPVQLTAWTRLSKVDHARILEIRDRSFPPYERSPRDSIALRSSWLWTAKSIDDEIAGFATAVILDRARVAFLEYLAVDSSLRGQGIGTAILRSVLKDLEVGGVISGVVLEVDDPERMSKDDPFASRRIAFYKRWGAEPLRCLHDYVIPDLSDPVYRVPMLLLWRGIDNVSEPRGEDLGQILSDLYREYYSNIVPKAYLDEIMAGIIC